MRPVLALVGALVAGYALASLAPGGTTAACPVEVDLRSTAVEPVVGDEVRIEITSLGCDPQTVTVTALSGVTSARFDVDIHQRRGSAVVPDHLTRTGGDLTVLANGTVRTIVLAPGPPAGPVRAWVGPRTIVADGADETMAVAAPADRFGNPVADGTPIETFRQRLSSVDRRAGRTMMGLAWVTYTSGTAAVRADVWTDTETATGERVTVLEVPGPVERIEMEPLAGPFPAADGRSGLPLLTAVLTDANGNLLPDGIGGEFVIDAPDGRHLVPAVVTAGRLRATWVVPGRPGVSTLSARIQGQQSPDVTVTLRSAIEQLLVQTRPTGDGLVVEVGPVVTKDGGLVADGTPVAIGDVTTTLSTGTASAILPSTTRAVVVEVLGHRTRLEIPS